MPVVVRKILLYFSFFLPCSSASIAADTIPVEMHFRNVSEVICDYAMSPACSKTHKMKTRQECIKGMASPSEYKKLKPVSKPWSQQCIADMAKKVPTDCSVSPLNLANMCVPQELITKKFGSPPAVDSICRKKKTAVKRFMFSFNTPCLEVDFEESDGACLPMKARFQSYMRNQASEKNRKNSVVLEPFCSSGVTTMDKDLSYAVCAGYEPSGASIAGRSSNIMKFHFFARSVAACEKSAKRISGKLDETAMFGKKIPEAFYHTAALQAALDQASEKSTSAEILARTKCIRSSLWRLNRKEFDKNALAAAKKGCS